MKENKILIAAIFGFTLITLLFVTCNMYGKNRIELIPFGDFETWEIQEIKESGIIGGNTKSLYKIGDQTSPWGTSNAHAKVSGIDKVSNSVRKSQRGDNNMCCRLMTKLEVVNAIGVLNFKALATGSIFTGKKMEIVGMEQSKDPASAIDMGIPFTQKPTALILDYKATIQDKQVVFANAGLKTKDVEGKDRGQVVVILQHRWEEDGHVYAYRVGTAHYLIENTEDWINDFRIPIEYGKVKDINEFKALSCTRHKTHNSKGKMVYIEEEDWKGDITPTHIIIQISSGCMEAFTGCPNNTVWCDNIRLEYND